MQRGGRSPPHTHTEGPVTYRDEGHRDRETKRTDQQKQPGKAERENPRGQSMLKRTGRLRSRQAEDPKAKVGKRATDWRRREE